MNSMKSNVSTDRLSIADLNLGDRTELGKYTISTDDIVTFARQWDPQFFHIDEERAVTDGYFGGIIASGIQTLAIFQRLSVKSFIQNLNVIGGAGSMDCSFADQYVPVTRSPDPLLSKTSKSSPTEVVR